MGLNYLGVQWVADRLQIKFDADGELFEKLQVLESHWLYVINKPDDKPK